MNLNIVSDAKTLDDARLVELSLDGNRDAFGHLVARYQSPVCALAYNACGNISQSEDLAQETFIIAWRKLADLKEPAKFKSWLYGIARNLLNNSFRRQTRNPLAASEPLDEGLTSTATQSNPTDHAISKEEQEILWRSLEQIPDPYREPLILFYRENQSVERVAAILELSEDATRQRLSRGRKLLHQQVIAFIEGALKQTVPTQVFTLAVLAALPVMTISARAATLGAISKGGAAAKGASLLGLGSAIFAPMLPFFGMWMDYRLKRKAGHSKAELKLLKVYSIGIALSVLVFVFVCTTLMSYAGSLIKTSPALFASLISGLILGYFVLIGFFARWFFRASKKLAAEKPWVEPVGRFQSPLWEYRSRFELLGLPFIHIRFGGWLGGRVEERLARSKKPLRAWIAITDGFAVGVLFAYGGFAIAPVSVGAATFGIFSFGALSIGALAVGGFAFGIWALAIFSCGWQAFGDCAIAWNAAWGGQYAVAHHFAVGDAAHALQVNNDFVWHLFKANPFFQFCRNNLSVSRMILISWIWIIPMMISMIAQICIAACKQWQKSELNQTKI